MGTTVPAIHNVDIHVRSIETMQTLTRFTSSIRWLEIMAPVALPTKIECPIAKGIQFVALGLVQQPALDRVVAIRSWLSGTLAPGNCAVLYPKRWLHAPRTVGQARV